MGDAVIISATRTAIGTARRGSLVDYDAFDLGKFAVQEALKRSSVPVEDVDDIVLGEVLQGGGDIARYIAVELGMLEVPGLAHNRHCASSLASVQSAAASIRAGMDRVVIAGGAESLTQSPQVFKKQKGSYSGVDAVALAEPPRHARGARPRHVDHRRVEHRAEVRHHARGAGRVGVPLAHARDRGHRRGTVPRRDLRRRGARGRKGSG